MTYTTDELVDRLKFYVQEMQKELDRTRYPDRAERLPDMIAGMKKAIAHLEAKNGVAQRAAIPPTIFTWTKL